MSALLPGTPRTKIAALSCLGCSLIVMIALGCAALGAIFSAAQSSADGQETTEAELVDRRGTDELMVSAMLVPDDLSRRDWLTSDYDSSEWLVGPRVPCYDDPLFRSFEMDGTGAVYLSKRGRAGEQIEERLVLTSEPLAIDGMERLRDSLRCSDFESAWGSTLTYEPLEVPPVGDEVFGYHIQEFEEDMEDPYWYATVILARQGEILISLVHWHPEHYPELTDTVAIVETALEKAESVIYGTGE